MPSANPISTWCVIEPVGRRDRKKAATRRTIADAALALFHERGFDHVGVREIAEAADVSTATLFKHFATKEALVFDEDVDQEAQLETAVRDKAPGQGIVAALHAHARAVVAAVDPADPDVRRFLALIEGSQTLRDYSRRMWLRHKKALAAAIAEAAEGVHPTTCAALAHYVLETRSMLHGEPRPVEAVDRIFALLERGWTGLTA
jgi:AcrR family transcriptional regulator